MWTNEITCRMQCSTIILYEAVIINCLINPIKSTRLYGTHQEAKQTWLQGDRDGFIVPHYSWRNWLVGFDRNVTQKLSRAD